MVVISSKEAGELQNKEKTFQGQRFDRKIYKIDPLSDQYPYNSTYAFSER